MENLSLFCGFVKVLNCLTHIYTPVRDLRVAPSVLSVVLLKFSDITFFFSPHWEHAWRRNVVADKGV